MITVLGADWCHGCEAILEKLEELAFQEPEIADPRWSALQNLKK